MRYILKYELKSKYFGFVKVYYKEFNRIFEINQFIKNNNLKKCEIYENMKKGEK